jgi:hypothetical protein
MKPSIKIVTCFAFLVALLAVSCGSPQTTESETAAVENESAGPENDLIGVWEIIGSTVEFPPDMNQETVVNDTHLPGIVIFTKKYYSWVDFHGGDSLPELPEEPTDAQIAAVYKQLGAGTGTYELEGSSLKRNPIVTKNPNQMGGGDEILYEEYAVEGDMLTICWMLENQIRYTLKFQRLE